MSEKDSRDSFYFLNAYQDGITPGQKITIQHNVSYNDWRAAPHLAPLVKLTDAEINQRKEASITLEKELYAKLKQIASEWMSRRHIQCCWSVRWNMCIPRR